MQGLPLQGSILHLVLLVGGGAGVQDQEASNEVGEGHGAWAPTKPVSGLSFLICEAHVLIIPCPTGLLGERGASPETWPIAGAQVGHHCGASEPYFGGFPKLEKVRLWSK